MTRILSVAIVVEGQRCLVSVEEHAPCRAADFEHAANLSTERALHRPAANPILRFVGDARRLGYGYSLMRVKRNQRQFGAAGAKALPRYVLTVTRFRWLAGRGALPRTSADGDGEQAFIA